MKTETKPTLEEVKEYFKNVAEIKGHYSNDKIKIDTEKFGVTINFDTYNPDRPHSVEFYYLDEHEREIPITTINTKLITVILLK